MSRGEPYIDIHDVRGWIQSATDPEEQWQVDRKEVLDWIDWHAAEAYAARADEVDAVERAVIAENARNEAYRAVAGLINGLNEMVDSLRMEFPDIPEL